MNNQHRNPALSMLLIVTPAIYSHVTHPWTFSKSKFNLKSDCINLVVPASPISVCFIYPMSGRYSTNWDRKGWPGSEIQMHYDCPSRERFYRDAKIFVLEVNPLNLDSQNQTFPVVLTSFPIWGKSVKGKMSYDRTYKQTDNKRLQR